MELKPSWSVLIHLDTELYVQVVFYYKFRVVSGVIQCFLVRIVCYKENLTQGQRLGLFIQACDERSYPCLKNTCGVLVPEAC